VNHYIAVSRNVESGLYELGVEPKDISVLYNGVDISRFRFAQKRVPFFTERYGWPEESVIVGMTGQMNAAKGHHDFLQAARLIRGSHPEVRFVIGGKQDSVYFQDLQKLVRENHLDDTVAFSGWQDDMTSFYSGIDIFVLPSAEDTEGLPLVVAEAMASGLPVVATRSGGAQEIVEAGKTGMLVERQSPRELARAITSLLASLDRRAAMGKEGRRRVEEFFDLSKQAAQFERILESVAKGSGRVPAASWDSHVSST
jgi:glycosyltransferase involved in cell wall biosynthesis